MALRTVITDGWSTAARSEGGVLERPVSLKIQAHVLWPTSLPAPSR
jgi:hypothetical protein